MIWDHDDMIDNGSKNNVSILSWLVLFKGVFHLQRGRGDHELLLSHNWVFEWCHEVPELLAWESFSGTHLAEIQHDGLEDVRISLPLTKGSSFVTEWDHVEGPFFEVVDVWEGVQEGSAEDSGSNGKYLGILVTLIIKTVLVHKC